MRELKFVLMLHPDGKTKSEFPDFLVPRLERQGFKQIEKQTKTGRKNGKREAADSKA